MIIKIAKAMSLWTMLGTLAFMPVASMADSASKIAVVDAKVAIFGSNTAQPSACHLSKQCMFEDKDIMQTITLFYLFN